VRRGARYARLAVERLEEAGHGRGRHGASGGNARLPVYGMRG
jgi:hypothetical protein